MPFTVDQFLHIFESYNQAIGIAGNAILLLVALFVIYLILRQPERYNQTISWIMALLWLWTGTVYHGYFFSSINRAAFIFGAFFVIQGFLFVRAGVLQKSLVFEFRNNVYGITGAVFVFYALVGYPVLGYFTGHIYPEAPLFGVPCPTTIFTWGILLWAIYPVRHYLLVIPLIWSLVGFSAAVQLNVIQDFGLVLAGVVGYGMILIRDCKKTQKVSEVV